MRARKTQPLRRDARAIAWGSGRSGSESPSWAWKGLIPQLQQYVHELDVRRLLSAEQCFERREWIKRHIADELEQSFADVNDMCASSASNALTYGDGRTIHWASGYVHNGFRLQSASGLNPDAQAGQICIDTETGQTGVTSVAAKGVARETRPKAHASSNRSLANTHRTPKRPPINPTQIHNPNKVALWKS